MAVKFAVDNQPLGRFCSLLSRQYLGILSLKSEKLPIDRYYYPFLLIAENDGKLSQKELSSRLCIDKATLVKYIDYLASKKVIKRETNPDDRRGCLLSLTKKGRETYPALKEAFVKTEKIMLKDFSAEEVKTLVCLMDKLKMNLIQEPAARVELKYSTKKK